MTNPDQTVGTNAGFNGRTTPNAMNDILGAFSRGRISGWACTPKNGMTVQLGGNGTTRDVAIAEDNAGNRLTINNRTATPVEITLAGAPATGNRIDSIVAAPARRASTSRTQSASSPSKAPHPARQARQMKPRSAQASPQTAQAEPPPTTSSSPTSRLAKA